MNNILNKRRLIISLLLILVIIMNLSILTACNSKNFNKLYDHIKSHRTSKDRVDNIMTYKLDLYDVAELLVHEATDVNIHFQKRYITLACQGDYNYGKGLKMYIKNDAGKKYKFEFTDNDNKKMEGVIIAKDFDSARKRGIDKVKGSTSLLGKAFETISLALFAFNTYFNEKNMDFSARDFGFRDEMIL